MDGRWWRRVRDEVAGVGESVANWIVKKWKEGRSRGGAADILTPEEVLN